MENDDNPIQEEISNYFASRRPAKILMALVGAAVGIYGAIHHNVDVAGFGGAELVLAGAMTLFDKIAENAFPQAAREGWDEKWDAMERPSGKTQSHNYHR